MTADPTYPVSFQVRQDGSAAAGTSANSAGKSDGCAAQKVLIISIGGTPYYIPAFDQNT